MRSNKIDLYKFYWNLKSEWNYPEEKNFLVYLSFGYTNSITNLIQLFELAKADYPEVDPSKMEVLQIVNSMTMKGYYCISFLIDRDPLSNYKYDESC